MTVKELKEILEDCDDDMLIVVERQEYGHREVAKTERVRFTRWMEKNERTALCIIGKSL